MKVYSDFPSFKLIIMTTTVAIIIFNAIHPVLNIITIVLSGVAVIFAAI